jgi:2-isopropylmalate synthase
MSSDIIRIFDTTLRDGEQSPGYSMTMEEKIRFAVQLEKLNVDVIEAGFPVSSPDDFSAVKSIAERIQHAEVCGLARAIENDITTCFNAIKNAKHPRIHTFMSTSKIHLEHQFKKTEAEAFTIIINAVKHAKSLCENVEFSPMDAGRTDKTFLIEIITAAIESGAKIINIADTVGYQIPEEFGKFVHSIRESVPNAKKAVFSVHCHNDLGLATANSLAGVVSGARQIECTVNGIGERAGNASMEEVVMAIKTRSDFFHLKTNINTKEIMRTSNVLKHITGQAVQRNKAIVGKNAFAHESGIHQHGYLAKSETYEIMSPQDIGLDKSDMVLGKHSGRAALKSHLKIMGYKITDEKLNDVFMKFKQLADKKKSIEDADLDALVIGEFSGQKAKYTLEDLQVSTGISIKPTATVSLRDENDKILTKSAEGTGPVDAAFKSIEVIIGKFGKLTEFRMDSVTEGLDAQAVVSLVLETDIGKFFGRSGNTDIIVASVQAYLDAIEKYLRKICQKEEGGKHVHL